MKGIGFYGENGMVFQDEDRHIIENVKRILTTRRGERIGNLSFGSDVSKYLFMPELSIDDLINEIVNSIRRSDPRIEVVECALAGNEEGNLKIDLTIRDKSTGREIPANIEI